MISKDIVHEVAYFCVTMPYSYQLPPLLPLRLVVHGRSSSKYSNMIRPLRGVLHNIPTATLLAPPRVTLFALQSHSSRGDAERCFRKRATIFQAV